MTGFLVSRYLWGIWQGALLPVAYALTFDTQTLSESDIARVREMARLARASAEESGEAK